MELKINPEYEKILPKLTEEEYQALKNSIKEDGQLYPIITNENLVILDGHHRYKVCKELGIEPRYEIRKFDNPLLEKKFVIEVNLKRRHLLPFQKAEMGMALLEVEKELARQRQYELAKKGEPLESIDAKGKATELVAKKIGLSEKTFERAVKVIQEAPAFIKERARKGDISIFEGYTITVLLAEIPDSSKRKALEEKLEAGELSVKDLKKIVVSSQAAESLLQREPSIAEEFEDKLWTPELNLEEIKERLNEVFGFPEQAELVVEGSTKFKDELEASNWVAKFGGSFEGVKVLWYFKVPKKYLDKAKEEAERR